MFKLIMTLVTSFVVFVSWGNEGFLPKTFSASFLQIQISSLTGKQKESEGRVSYEFPGKIKFEVLRPDVLTFVSNPEKTWYYTGPFIQGEPGELTIKSTGKLPLTRIFDALKKGLVSNDLYQVKENGKNVVLDFISSFTKEVGYEKVSLEFKDKKTFSEVEKIELQKPDKTKVTLKFSNLKTDETFAKDYFTFIPPSKTHITQ